MNWPLRINTGNYRLEIPGPGRYVLGTDADAGVIDTLLAAARAQLGDAAVGWLPEDGGLLSNLPAWENLVLARQWHAPATVPGLETSIAGWCARLGHDATGTARLLASPPAQLADDERRQVGWLRQLLLRPRLLLLECAVLPPVDAPLHALIDDVLADAALLVIDAASDARGPAGFAALSFQQTEVVLP